MQIRFNSRFPFLFSAAMYMLSAIGFSPLGGLLSNTMGRRFCFISLGIVSTIGWIVVNYTFKSFTCTFLKFSFKII
jgi:hypothetical protein